MKFIIYHFLGFKMAMATCKSWHDDTVVDDSKCDHEDQPTKKILPCNMHPCPTK